MYDSTTKNPNYGPQNMSLVPVGSSRPSSQGLGAYMCYADQNPINHYRSRPHNALNVI